MKPERFLERLVLLHSAAVIVAGALVWLASQAGGMLWAITLALALLAALFVFWRYAATPRLFRQLGIRARASKRIVLRHHREYILSPAGVRATFTQHFVFLGDIDDEDRVDIFDVAGQSFPDGFVYESPDAVEKRRVMIAPSVLKIYWEPKGALKPFTKYVHTKSYFVPDDYDSAEGGGYIFDFLVDAESGEVTATITAHVPIARAVFFKYPRFFRIADDKKVFQHGLNPRETGPTPTLEAPNRLIWEAANLEVGRRYALVVYYKGFEDKIAIPRRRSWIGRWTARDHARPRIGESAADKRAEDIAVE